MPFNEQNTRLRVARPRVVLLTLGWLGVVLTFGATVQAQDAPSSLARGVHELPGAVENHLDARSWRLDSAVFTEIRPFTVPDIAILLPAEQQDELPVESANALPSTNLQSPAVPPPVEPVP